MVEIVRTERVGEDGVLHFDIGGLEPGESVQVVLRSPERAGLPMRKPDAQGRYRTLGGLEGKVRIAPDFDDPLPDMEPYS